MITKYVLPAIAAMMLLFAAVYVVQNRVTWPQTKPETALPRAPYEFTVAGAGLVEAETENITIGSPIPGVVVELFGAVGRTVKKGDPLFRLDERPYLAELKVREAALAGAQADLLKLENQPRPEEVPVHEARVKEAEANLAEMQHQYNRVKELVPKGAATNDELVTTGQTYKVAQARLAEIEAQFALLKAGAWEFDKKMAQATVTRAQAQVEQAKTDLERLTIRALVDGEVLQVNVRPGEFVGTPPNAPLIVLGNIQQLHVRVDIDEYDIPRFRPGTPASAALRGNPEQQFPLTFVRVEPYVIPKRSLTGENTERVDTRVLQVIYKLDTQGRQLYVGQQLDVYIQSNPDNPVQMIATRPDSL